MDIQEESMTDHEGQDALHLQTPMRTPSKVRSYSDSVPALAPSPRFLEPTQTTQDDHAIGASSRLPMNLDLPPRENLPQPTAPASRTIASPSVEAYSPTTVLPRHSRGMDFSRAATHLHHSTLAGQQSPDSSPTITHKSLASRRTSSHSMALDSPRLNPGWGWNNAADKSFFSRSVGSTVALTSDTSSSGSGDDEEMIEQDDPDDAMMSTPQVHKMMDASAVTPYAGAEKSRPPDWLAQHSPNPHAFTNLREGRRRRHGPGSIGRRSRLTTPDPQPQRQHRDSVATGRIAKDHLNRSPQYRRNSRRESLSLGTNHLHLTSSHESGDEGGVSNMPEVVRRPVVRRSNLLPKTKGFARIRAALQEESAPVENEFKREAEVVKQVHQNYKDHDWNGAANSSGGQMTAPPSPSAVPKIGREESSVSMSDIDFFSNGAAEELKLDPDHRRSCNQKEFWPNMYNRIQTPPPLGRPRSSSNMSEDVGMDSPYMSRRSTPPSSGISGAATNTNIPKPTVETNFAEARPSKMPTAAEISQKVNSKRRRDDDFDIASIKRRAVSPGLSVQSSPVPGQSPLNGGSWWGQPKLIRETTLPSANVEERASSVGQVTTPVLGPVKKTGLQGMADTSDGLMKMSIE